MERHEKEYTFTVYRTVQQSVRVTVPDVWYGHPNNREVDGKRLAQLANEAEWEAERLHDGEWKTEEVDMVHAIYEEYAKRD